MKTIGLIGGMSWESTTLYYQIINREVARRRGGLSSARMNLVSLDFQDIAQRQRVGDWDGMAGILCDAARRLSDTRYLMPDTRLLLTSSAARSTATRPRSGRRSVP